MTRGRRIAFDLVTRLFCVLIFLLFPIVAVLGAPWAFFNSVGTWGHTTWDDWLGDWRIYSPRSLREALRQLTKPIPR